MTQLTANNTSSLSLQPGDILLVVDVQNDFLPGGSLAVPHGDEILPVLNRYIQLFSDKSLPIIATRDWHPANHCSFEEFGGIWPAHCIARSTGAEFSAELALPRSAMIISKATKPDTDAYSGFQDTRLDRELVAMSANRLFIGGLATDYCVLNTVIDALDHHYDTYLLLDAIRAVNVQQDDEKKALETMRQHGAIAITTSDIT